MKEIFVPATLNRVTTIDPGELRIIELILPTQFQVEQKMYPLIDAMRPGTAFLAKPFGARTGKWRRRMYTRSNCSTTSPRHLETMINYTHQEKSDTSLWWQGSQVCELQQGRQPIEVRVAWNDNQSALNIYESSARCQSNNLRLEPDGEWESMRLVGLAFSTGITPFLSHIRYMHAHQFGRCDGHRGIHYTLIVSARQPSQLMAHEELLEVERAYPDNFRYWPVLTRSWPSDWSFPTGRIMRVEPNNRGEPSQIDLTPLLNIIPDIQHCHIRLCGKRMARNQLEAGLRQRGIVPLSFRAEVW